MICQFWLIKKVREKKTPINFSHKLAHWAFGIELLVWEIGISYKGNFFSFYIGKKGGVKGG